MAHLIDKPRGNYALNFKMPHTKYKQPPEPESDDPPPKNSLNVKLGKIDVYRLYTEKERILD
jgi:hypothetical protein